MGLAVNNAKSEVNAGIVEGLNAMEKQPYTPYVTELVRDRGPRIDTVPFPPAAAVEPQKEKCDMVKVIRSGGRPCTFDKGHDGLCQPYTKEEQAILRAGSKRPEMAPLELFPEQLIAVSFDPTKDASLPPRGRWVYLKDALRAAEKAVERAASVQPGPPPDDEELFKAVAVLTNYDVTREMYEEYLNKVNYQPAAPRTQPAPRMPTCPECGDSVVWDTGDKYAVCNRVIGAYPNLSFHQFEIKSIDDWQQFFTALPEISSSNQD